MVTAVVMLATGHPILGGLNLAVVPACAPPRVVERWARVRIPGTLLTMYALILLGAPWAGTTLDLYGLWSPWDTVVHFFSGIPIGLGWLLVFGVTARRSRLVLPPWLEALVITALGAFTAVLWEVSEYTSDQTIGTQAQFNNQDTMVDMMVGTLGGLLVAVALYLHRTRGAFRWLSRYDDAAVVAG